MSTTTQEPHLDLSDEYEHEPVPAQARRSLTSIAAVWFGFPMNLGNAVFGGVIVYNLGTVAGLGAILIGNIVLFAYVGALSYIAGRTGKSFSLQAAATFGDRGRVIAAAFLATVVLGWFSFQIGLTGTTLQGALGWSAVLGAIIGGILYTGITIVGIRALSWLGMIAAPLFIVSGPELVIAQCKAGIVGSFPALNARPPEMLDCWFGCRRVFAALKS